MLLVFFTILVLLTRFRLCFPYRTGRGYASPCGSFSLRAAGIFHCLHVHSHLSLLHAAPLRCGAVYMELIGGAQSAVLR